MQKSIECASPQQTHPVYLFLLYLNLIIKPSIDYSCLLLFFDHFVRLFHVEISLILLRMKPKWLWEENFIDIRSKALKLFLWPEELMKDA